VGLLLALLPLNASSARQCRNAVVLEVANDVPDRERLAGLEKLRHRLVVARMDAPRGTTKHQKRPHRMPDGSGKDIFQILQRRPAKLGVARIDAAERDLEGLPGKDQ